MAYCISTEFENQSDQIILFSRQRLSCCRLWKISSVSRIVCPHKMPKVCMQTMEEQKNKTKHKTGTLEWWGNAVMLLYLEMDPSGSCHTEKETNRKYSCSITGFNFCICHTRVTFICDCPMAKTGSGEYMSKPPGWSSLMKPGEKMAAVYKASSGMLLRVSRTR